MNNFKIWFYGQSECGCGHSAQPTTPSHKEETKGVSEEELLALLKNSNFVTLEQVEELLSKQEPKEEPQEQEPIVFDVKLKVDKNYDYTGIECTYEELNQAYNDGKIIRLYFEENFGFFNRTYYNLVESRGGYFEFNAIRRFDTDGYSELYGDALLSDTIMIIDPQWGEELLTTTSEAVLGINEETISALSKIQELETKINSLVDGSEVKF